MQHPKATVKLISFETFGPKLQCIHSFETVNTSIRCNNNGFAGRNGSMNYAVRCVLDASKFDTRSAKAGHYDSITNCTQFWIKRFTQTRFRQACSTFALPVRSIRNPARVRRSEECGRVESLLRERPHE